MKNSELSLKMLLTEFSKTLIFRNLRTPS